jgi:hypothetical protein
LSPCETRQHGAVSRVDRSRSRAHARAQPPDHSTGWCATAAPAVGGACRATPGRA